MLSTDMEVVEAMEDEIKMDVVGHGPGGARS